MEEVYKMRIKDNYEDYVRNRINESPLHQLGKEKKGEENATDKTGNTESSPCGGS